MKKYKALITGFEPFDSSSCNPSWLAVEALPEKIGAFSLVRLCLPVSFKTAFAVLEKAVDSHRPDLVICTGLAARRSHISVERVAINVDDARIPDNDGHQPVESIIDYSAPNAYFSGLPGRAIVSRITAAGLPAAVSDTAGTFVCNNVMFRLLHMIANKVPHIMGGFIHVPATPQLTAAGTEWPGMPLTDIARGLHVAVEACADAFSSGSWKGARRTIVLYDESWAREFTMISSRLQAGLGSLAKRIDHIGSTSVPGLSAKDIIDIQVTVDGLSDQLLDAFTSMGYSRSERAVSDHFPPGLSSDPQDWQKWFFRAPPGQRPTNTHVRIAGRANQRYPLLFRDFLRAHPDYSQAYGELKTRLAANIANSRMYPDVKDPAVDLIYFAAEKWARETGWQP